MRMKREERVMLNVNMNDLHKDWRIEEITWGAVAYKRPRIAGCNARLGVHGWGGDVPIARIKIGGIYGFGWCTLNQEQARKILGVPVTAIFDEKGMLGEEYYGIEFPILDWLGQVLKKPVYQIVAKNLKTIDCNDYTVPVYDTSIYFDELAIKDNQEAVEFICREVDAGLARGHRNFKVKIGRCGMWMDVDEGLQRDIDIILGIRKRIGSDGKLMVDANNGYNLSLTKRFLNATSSAKLHWLEEAFHEDDQLYTRLKQWMKEKNIHTMIADGEGYACSEIENWAKKGLIDVLQYDLRGYGFFRWMKLGTKMDTYGVLSAPHNYGGFYGNYAQAHFAAAIDGFAFAEWDQADAEGIDTSAYYIRDGVIHVPNEYGFGLKLDVDVFKRIVEKKGWNISL